ncbi:hypothetical protein P168DRAFT_327046 [Aspergillus campestris IBT 28561]|uniref:Eisosome protein 1 n=1 Tax=Aspergillus campestris (strain IBT 28561) TaxID=1392248 RepID=A0A2I1D2C5_ASPC2|nr:uncharacterized protein P168DRAFT_327046 [Aspergillus campestris IBT 28561]PKY04025.1 hypothetical protein P168DRAFT_327046 [Aspergillus campestris IBT 28561]
MATVEQPPVQRIPRSRSARLADQAATAALYVTHPERRLSIREPAATAETEQLNIKATGSRPSFSHASAVAALAHAKNRQVEKQAVYDVQVHRGSLDGTSEHGYKAALHAVRDGRPSGSVDLGRGMSVTDQRVEAQRGPAQKGRAINAASGAFKSRNRADSAPSDAPHSVSFAEDSEAPSDIGHSIGVGKLDRVASNNARLYTASPPVAPEVEEQRKKSVVQAAAISMAQEMYQITGPTGEGGTGAPRKQSGPLQQAINLQETAQRIAAEKLAAMEDENALYREYYAVNPEEVRSETPTRRRRLSVDSDSTSGFDVDRSRHIRFQMSSLRSRLDAVDEKRETDRSMLLEAARRNVDATMRDMEMRVYAETGRAPPSMQRDWEDAALMRARKDVLGRETESIHAEKVDLGAKKYMDMADIEAVARSRLQPTLNEITDRAEGQRARELEKRLDEEERERYEAIYREREAELRAEEKEQKAYMKYNSKNVEEKSWPWRRKSRQDEQEAFASGAVSGYGGAEAKSESKFKSWFRGKRGSRSSMTAPETSREIGTGQEPASSAVGRENPIEKTTEEPAAPAQKASEGAEDAKDASARQIAAVTGGPSATEETSEAAKETTEAPRESIEAPKESTESAAEENRRAALRSHPVTADELTDMQTRRMSSVDEGQAAAMAQKAQQNTADHASDKPSSRLKSRLSRMLSGGSSRSGLDESVSDYNEDAQTDGQKGTPRYAHAMPDERELLRESATDQGLPAPAAGKNMTNGAGRESRFSEDL